MVLVSDSMAAKAYRIYNQHIQLLQHLRQRLQILRLRPQGREPGTMRCPGGGLLRSMRRARKAHYEIHIVGGCPLTCLSPIIWTCSGNQGPAPGEFTSRPSRGGGGPSGPRSRPERARDPGGPERGGPGVPPRRRRRDLQSPGQLRCVPGEAFARRLD